MVRKVRVQKKAKERKAAAEVRVEPVGVPFEQYAGMSYEEYAKTHGTCIPECCRPNLPMSELKELRAPNPIITAEQWQTFMFTFAVGTLMLLTTYLAYIAAPAADMFWKAGMGVTALVFTGMAFFAAAVALYIGLALFARVEKAFKKSGGE